MMRSLLQLLPCSKIGRKKEIKEGVTERDRRRKKGWQEEEGRGCDYMVGKLWVNLQ